VFIHIYVTAYPPVALAPPPCSAFVLLFFAAFHAMPACRYAKSLFLLHIATDCSSVSIEKGCLIKGLCAYVQKCITGCTPPAKMHTPSTTSRTDSNHKASAAFPSNSSHVRVRVCKNKTGTTFSCENKSGTPKKSVAIMQQK